MTRVLILLLFLSGCSLLASREATVACQTADTVTTVVALKSASAHEANPIMAGVIKNLGLPGFVLVKALILWAMLAYHDNINETARAAINVATCGVAASNVAVIAQ